MSGASAFFIIIPAAYALFAIALATIAWWDKRLVAARWAAGGFLVATASILVDGFRDPAGDVWSAWFAVFTHFLALYIMVQAFLQRHGRNVPRITQILMVIAAVGVMPAMPWAPPYWLRGVLVQLICTAVIVSAMPQLLRLRRHSSLDWVVFAVIAGAAISYGGRTVVMILNPIGPSQADLVSFYEGLNIIFHSASALMGLSVGIVLMMTIGFDMVRHREQEGETDALTRLGNRRLLDRWISEDESGDRNVGAAIAVDLDHFKRVNDNYGHDAGDLVLRQVARVMRHHLGPYGITCRTGGEEFIALIEEQHGDAVSALSLGLKEAISGLSFEGPLSPLKITASIGFHRRSDGETLFDTMHYADQAVYCAKTDGRDRVVKLEIRNGMQLMKSVA